MRRSRRLASIVAATAVVAVVWSLGALGDGGAVGEGGAVGRGGTAGDGGVVAAAVVSKPERAALLDEREGFGRRAGSGAETWPVVLVTNLGDDGPGSLREAVAAGSRWVRFVAGLHGTITLSRPLSLVGDLVVDGRGADVTLRAAADTDLVQIHEVDNVVVSDLAFVGGEDAIQIFQGATDVWIHHVTAAGAADELVSVTGEGRRPDRITISWSRFEDAGKAMLLGASEREITFAPDRVTVHHNVFVDSRDRQPLVRFARVHYYNNHVVGWGASGTGQAVRVGADGQLASEGNVFDDTFGRPAMVPEDLGTLGRIRSTGDVTTGSTMIVERRPDSVFEPRDHYDYALDEAGDALREALTAAGPRGAG